MLPTVVERESHNVALRVDSLRKRSIDFGKTALTQKETMRVK